MNLTAKIFNDENAAREHIEASRWSNGVVCPHCGSFDVMRMAGKTQAGMFLCRDCRDKFTCRTGTVMERSHIPLHKWLLALHLMASSKKGISALQLQRNLGLGSYKSAWFLAMRCREAMGIDAKGEGPLGGPGETVEADATFIGGKESNKHANKRTKGTVRGRIGKQNLDRRMLPLKLLRQQAAYFELTRKWLLWFDLTLRQRGVRHPETWTKPPEMPPPPKHYVPPSPKRAPKKPTRSGKQKARS